MAQQRMAKTRGSSDSSFSSRAVPFSANGKAQCSSKGKLNNNPLHLQSASEVKRDLIYFLGQSCRGGGMGIIVPSL